MLLLSQSLHTFWYSAYIFTKWVPKQWKIKEIVWCDNFLLNSFILNDWLMKWLCQAFYFSKRLLLMTNQLMLSYPLFCVKNGVTDDKIFLVYFLQIPPPPPRPDFDASREKLQKLGEGEGSMTKEEFSKMKQELEACVVLLILLLFSLVLGPS